MRQTTASSNNVFDFDALLHPGTAFERPKDVVCDNSLSVGENGPSSLADPG
jgi:hypothetical protein